eukprot:1419543-Lingulodinium_polyedra.AAC.1
MAGRRRIGGRATPGAAAHAQRRNQGLRALAKLLALDEHLVSLPPGAHLAQLLAAAWHAVGPTVAEHLHSGLSADALQVAEEELS